MFTVSRCTFAHLTSDIMLERAESLNQWLCIPAPVTTTTSTSTGGHCLQVVVIDQDEEEDVLLAAALEESRREYEANQARTAEVAVSAHSSSSSVTVAT